MAAAALIKLTQGATIGSGEAIKGTTGTLVEVENVDNTDVASWQIDLVYVDPASGISEATPFAYNDDDSTPYASFTPDVSGSYRWVLKVWEATGRSGDPDDTDIRVFNVPETNGLVVPPAQIWPRTLPPTDSGMTGNKPNEMNFSGQTRGWGGDGDSDGLLGELVRRVDEIQSYLEFVPGGGGVDLKSAPLTNFFSHAGNLDGSDDTFIAADSSPHLIDSYTFSGTDGQVLAIKIRVWCATVALYTGKHVYETTAYIQVGSSSSYLIDDPATSQDEYNPLSGLTLSYSISGTDTLEVYATSTASELYAAIECWNQPPRTLTSIGGIWDAVEDGTVVLAYVASHNYQLSGGTIISLAPIIGGTAADILIPPGTAPIYNASDGQFGGEPSIETTGTQYLRSTTPGSAMTISQPHETIVVCVPPTTTSSYQTLIDGTNTYAAEFSTHTSHSGGYIYSGGTGIDTMPIDHSQGAIQKGVFNSSSSEYTVRRADSTLNTLYGDVGTANPQGIFFFAAYGAISIPAAAKIYAVLHCQGLTTDDWNRLVAWVQTNLGWS